MKKLLLIACLVFLPRVAFATVLSETSSTTYVCSGASTYAIPWPFLEKSHIVVTRWLTATPAVVTTLVRDAAVSPSYTITMYNNGLTGLVTLTNGTTCATNYTLKITRQLPVTQEIAFRSQGTFLPSNHEYMADKLTMLLQQVQAGISQSADTATAISNHIGSADDHTAYFLLAGRSGGQNAKGGTDAGDDLTLNSTSNATKGNIHWGSASTYDELNTRLGLNDMTPSYTLDVNGVGRFTGALYAQSTLYGSLNAGGDLTLKGNSADANGHIYFGTASAYDQANDKFLLGALTHDALFGGELEVTTSALIPQLYGSTSSGGSMTLTSTNHATKGKIYFGSTTSYYNGVTDDWTFGNDVWALGVLYGSSAINGSLYLSATSSASKGDIVLGTSPGFVFDEANSFLGLGTASPSYPLEVIGDIVATDVTTTDDVTVGDDLVVTDDGNVGGDLWVEDAIYGGDGSGEGINIHATSHATKGDVEFFGDVRAGQADADVVYIGDVDNGPGDAATQLSIAGQNATAPSSVAWITNYEGTAAGVPLTLAGGKTAPTATSDIVWVQLANTSAGQISEIEFLLGGVGAQFAAASDERLKKNIKDTDVHGLEVVNGLRLRQFDWKDESKPHVKIGYVAQEVLDVYPDMVGVRSVDGMYKVGDGIMTPILIKAVQELSAQVESQQEQIDALLEIIEENQK